MKMHGETSSAACFSNGYMKEEGVHLWSAFRLGFVSLPYKLVKFIHILWGLDV